MTQEIKDNVREGLLTAGEVREILRIVKLPKGLPVVKVGRLVRIKTSDLRAYINQRRERRM